MNYWLLKSEPSCWSWDQQRQKGIEPWDGVRNYQANNFMKQMQSGDLAFFYHSVKNPQIMGVVEIMCSFYPDPAHSPFGYVDVKYMLSLKQPVTLRQIKADENLSHLLLLKQSRLSVMPIDSVSWHHILDLAQTKI